jgi:tetratricopeptide (TPR) repeat protein
MTAFDEGGLGYAGGTPLRKLPEDLRRLLDEAVLADSHADYSVAACGYRTVWRQRPEEPLVVLSLGRVLLLSDRASDARVVFADYVRRRGALANFEVTFGLGLAAYRSGDHVMAATVLADLVPHLREVAHPLLADALYYLGQARVKLGQSREAIGILADAVYERLTFREAWHALGTLLLRRGRLIHAMLIFFRALSHDRRRRREARQQT